MSELPSVIVAEFNWDYQAYDIILMRRHVNSGPSAKLPQPRLDAGCSGNLYSADSGGIRCAAEILLMEMARLGKKH